MRAFLRRLEEKGELHRVAVAVDPLLEIAAVTDRVCKGPGGGPALLFERVKNSPFSVLSNLFGSPRRTALALGSDDLESLAGRLERDLAAAGDGPAAERLGRLLSAPAWCPRSVANGPCREVAEAPDLTRLPALQAWPGDGGRYLTLPLVFTRAPDGETNCGMYRIQLLDRETAVVHWREGSDAARHHAAWRERGEAMPVAVALGGDPALTYAAGAPLPAGLDEAAFAGYLRGAPLDMVPASGGLAVPSGAEFVLEGHVAPDEERPEGPFGNHTGAYVPAAPRPLLRVTALSRRRDPLLPCTVVGPPPMEDCYLAQASERLFLRLLRCDHPELLDLRMPLETIFHGCALVRVRRGTDGQALLHRLWAGGLLKSARLLVLLGEDADLSDLRGCYWRAVNRADFGRDLHVDGRRLGVDASAPPPSSAVGPDAATRELVARRWAEYGIE